MLNSLDKSLFSHENSAGAAIAKELYVPTITPINRTHKNSLIVSPPKIIKASNVNNKVKLVFKDLPKLSPIAELALSLKDLAG